MALRDMVGTVKTATEGFGDVAKEKMGDWIDELNEGYTLLDRFGFRVTSLKIGMGALPDVRTEIAGSIDGIREEEVKQLAIEYQGKAIITALLNGLLMARKLWERVEVKLQNVTLTVAVGVPPKVDVEIH